jgi:hypothetical protein
MTRRELAVLFVAAPALAQTPAAQQPAQSSDPIAVAKDDLRQSAAQLAKAKLDITTEPAFRFKA